jgi:hypothetical protein
MKVGRSELSAKLSRGVGAGVGGEGANDMHMLPSIKFLPKSSCNELWESEERKSACEKKERVNAQPSHNAATGRHLRLQIFVKEDRVDWLGLGSVGTGKVAHAKQAVASAMGDRANSGRKQQSERGLHGGQVFGRWKVMVWKRGLWLKAKVGL